MSERDRLFWQAVVVNRRITLAVPCRVGIVFLDKYHLLLIVYGYITTNAFRQQKKL